MSAAAKMAAPRPTWLIPNYKQALQSCELGRTWRCSSDDQRVVMDKIAEQHDRLERWGEGVGYNKWFATGVDGYLNPSLWAANVDERLQSIYNAIILLREHKLLHLMFLYATDPSEAEATSARRRSGIGSFISRKKQSARWALKDKPYFEGYAAQLTAYVDEMYDMISDFHTTDLQSAARPTQSQQPQEQLTPVQQTTVSSQQQAAPLNVDITSLSIEVVPGSTKMTESEMASADYLQRGIKGMLDATYAGASHPAWATLAWKGIVDTTVIKSHEETEYCKTDHPSWSKSAKKTSSTAISSQHSQGVEANPRPSTKIP
jgi:hypothetical protein